jgi:hypothetical protein
MWSMGGGGTQVCRFTYASHSESLFAYFGICSGRGLSVFAVVLFECTHRYFVDNTCETS